MEGKQLKVAFDCFPLLVFCHSNMKQNVKSKNMQHETFHFITERWSLLLFRIKRPGWSFHFLFCLLQVDTLLRQSINPISLPSLSAIVVLNDTVLWTGNFGKRNGSDPLSGPPNEYTIYRWGHITFSCNQQGSDQLKPFVLDVTVWIWSRWPRKSDDLH